MATVDTDYCPTCGAKAGALAAICPACKTPLARTDTPDSSPRKSSHALNDPSPSRHNSRAVLGAADFPTGVEGHRILRELGRGGMGTVYLAREQGWNRDVALKVAHRGLTEKQIRRFNEEAALTARLQHPVIAPIYRMGRTADGRPYYSMKRVQGQTLAYLLQQVKEGASKAAENFGVRRRAAVLLAACEGVAYAHDHGIIHRDLKPSNLMIGDYGEVYVVDWGLARMLFAVGHPDELPDLADSGLPETHDNGEGSATGTARRRRISGTPAYMSPEQARGETRLVDRRADVWSLGAILFQLLTLNAPVDGKDASEIIKNLVDGRVLRADQFPGGRQAPRELLDILAKALSLDLDARYASAREMAEDLRDYLDGRGRWRLSYEWNLASGASPESAWIQSLGRWKLDARGLYPASRKSKGAVLLSQRRYLGDVRIEIQGQTMSAGAETGELSVLLCLPEPEPGGNETDGYCLQVGADWNTSAKICKNDVDLTVRSDVELLYGQNHVVAGQRVGNRLALEFNGDELLSFDDLVPLNGHRVGIYGWGNGCRITAIRIYQRGLDAVVSCMAVPDHDFNRGRFAEAFAGYARIAEELAGREEGWMARFKAGLSRLEADDPNGAEAEYAKLDGTPGEVLAHLGRAMISAREGDHRREMMRLGAARRTGAGTAMQGYVLARLWLRAEELFEANQFEPAIAYFSEAVQADAEGGKRRARALAAIANAQLQMNQVDEAVRTVERIEQGKLSYTDILRSLFGALVHHEVARGALERALERCAAFERYPDIAYHGWVQRAEIERLRGNSERALEHLAEAAKLATLPAQKAVVRHQAAMVDMEAGRLDEALKSFEELFAFKGTVELQVQQDQRVYLLAMKGQGTKALSVLATRLRNEDHRHRMILLAQLGKLLRLRGECSRGRECFLQALVQLRRYARQSTLDVELELGLTCLGLNEHVPATEAFNRVLAAQIPSLAQLLVQAFRGWKPGEPMPEPPEPSRECPWSRRGEYFFYLGEYALVNARREDAVRAYRRALIESPTRYRQASWLSAVRLKELGETLPKNTPDFPPLARRRNSGAAAEILGD